MRLPVEAFALHGTQGDGIFMTIQEVFGYPAHTSIEGGYDIRCALDIHAGAYSVQSETCFFATGALYLFCDALQQCYASLSGFAVCKMAYENELSFSLQMLHGGRARITGTYQQNPDVKTLLQFEMETDQSCFPDVIRSIRSLQAQFGGMRGIKP